MVLWWKRKYAKIFAKNMNNNHCFHRSHFRNWHGEEKSMHKKLFYIGQFKSQSYWKRAHVYMCTQSDMWIQTTSVIRSITLLRVYEKYHSNVCLATMLKSSKKCTVKTHWWPSQSQYSVLLVLQKGRHHYIFKFFYIDLVPKYKYFWKH